MTNWKRYTVNGEESVGNVRNVRNVRNKDFCFLRRDKDGTIKENLIIKGNNLLALHSLKKQFQNKVKLIYIDPPYNTGNDSFGYNDSFNHSTWLTFMKNRLEVAKDLLRDDGSIWINIDDNESHYLKVLCDDVFGRENFVANIIWHKKNVVQNDAKYFNQNHDHILVFAKNKEKWKPFLLERTEEMNARYENPDNDPRGLWTSVALQAKSGSESNIYEVEFENGVKWSPAQGTYPRLKKESLLLAYEEGRLWFGKQGNNVPRLKKYLNEVQQGVVPNTIFSNEDAGSTQAAKEELKKILGKNIFDTPKPEKLLLRILNIGSKKDDLVLDFFAGSGTTLAVAHKTGRQYIGIEQMDYIHDLPEARLKKVIGQKVKKSGQLIEDLEFDQSGISKAVNWKGGGDFVYCELMQYNESFMDKIQKADTTQKLINIWKEIKEKGFMKYQVDLEKFEAGIEEFKKFPLDKQKHTLIDTLNKNQLYVNLSEMNDKDFKVSADDKKINKEFYGGK